MNGPLLRRAPANPLRHPNRGNQHHDTQPSTLPYELARGSLTAHLALDPWAMAKAMEGDEKTVLQNDSWIDPDGGSSFGAGGRHLSRRHLRGYPGWKPRRDGDRDGLDVNEAVAAGCDFASGCLRWSGGGGGYEGGARRESPPAPGDPDAPEQQLAVAARMLLERIPLRSPGGGDSPSPPPGKTGRSRRDRYGGDAYHAGGSGDGPGPRSRGSGPGGSRPRGNSKVCRSSCRYISFH